MAADDTDGGLLDGVCMASYTSGPRRERIVRNGLFMLMCLGMGGYFLYDGLVGYPHANFEENRLQLPVDQRSKGDDATVYPGANLAHVDQIKQTLNDTQIGKRREAIATLIGGPPSVELGDSVYYFGVDGVIKIAKADDRLLQRMEVIPAKKSMKDIQLQTYLGIFIGAIAVYMAIFVIRVMRTRASVSDEGLSINRREPIPFDKMKSLDTTPFRKKGRVYVVCEGDPAPRILLDEYHYADFDKLMAALCERTGFADPVAEEKADKAHRSAANAETDSGQ